MATTVSYFIGLVNKVEFAKTTADDFVPTLQCQVRFNF